MRIRDITNIRNLLLYHVQRTNSNKFAMVDSSVVENKTLVRSVSYDCHGFAVSEEEGGHLKDTESQE